MIDNFNKFEKRHDRKILGMLRRTVPGEYLGLADIEHPLLDQLDLNLAEAIATPPANGAMASLFRAPGIPVRTKPFDQLMKSPESVLIFFDPAFGEGSYDSLWVCFLCDDPAIWFKALSVLDVKEGMTLIKHHRGQHLIALSGTTLKSIFKNA